MPTRSDWAGEIRYFHWTIYSIPGRNVSDETLTLTTGSLILRLAAVLAANIQNGPDLGVLQQIRSATVSRLNKFLLDAFPVMLIAGAS